MRGEWPLKLLPLGNVSLGAMLWRVVRSTPSEQAGAPAPLHLTLVVKATWGYDDEGDMSLSVPEPLIPADSAGAASSDLAPYLVAADTWFEGEACAAEERQSKVSVRVAVGRVGTLIDKTLHVYGDRERLPEGLSRPKPFKRLPLSYDRTIVGHVSPADFAARVANIVDPKDAERAAGFARLPEMPRRLALGEPRPREKDGVLEVPEGFDWQGFHAAPVDQRCGFLRGDEWILLDGLHPRVSHLRLDLPGACAEAQLFAPGAAEEGHPVAMWCDGLGVNGNTQRVTLRWRGCVPLSQHALLDKLTVVAGIATPDAPIEWAVEAPGKDTASIDLTDSQREVFNAVVAEERKAQTGRMAALRLDLVSTDAELMRDQLGIPLLSPEQEEPPADSSQTGSMSSDDASALRAQMPLPFSLSAAQPLRAGGLPRQTHPTLAGIAPSQPDPRILVPPKPPPSLAAFGPAPDDGEAFDDTDAD